MTSDDNWNQFLNQQPSAEQTLDVSDVQRKAAEKQAQQEALDKQRESWLDNGARVEVSISQDRVRDLVLESRIKQEVRQAHEAAKERETRDIKQDYQAQKETIKSMEQRERDTQERTEKAKETLEKQIVKEEQTLEKTELRLDQKKVAASFLTASKIADKTMSYGNAMEEGIGKVLKELGKDAAAVVSPVAPSLLETKEKLEETKERIEALKSASKSLEEPPRLVEPLEQSRKR